MKFSEAAGVRNTVFPIPINGDQQQLEITFGNGYGCKQVQLEPI